MKAYQKEFLDLAIAKKVLRFGTFTLKSGRVSPYFFNAGAFDDGASMAVLGDCYAHAIADSGIEWDVLFGPAYKGIPLATAVAVAVSRLFGTAAPYAYNRKEVKDHGEGGQLVGANVQGRVLVIDDVISAGTSIRESTQWIRAEGAELAGVGIALDRQEKGSGGLSAVEEIRRSEGIPVISIVNLATLIAYLEQTATAGVDLNAIREYRNRYGTDT